ncbi:hypothetical protein BGY98DRAFT_1033117 [Russula aff. rugulosa BPL654]|nr:hypothetical protein BGY98DRAFT_1033117 [Russula aff. rugulosa BPL654]
MLTFVRRMKDWLGGIVSIEDVGEETFRKRSNKRRRDDDADEEAIGTFALRLNTSNYFLTRKWSRRHARRKTRNSFLPLQGLD